MRKFSHKKPNQQYSDKQLINLIYLNPKILTYENFFIYYRYNQAYRLGKPNCIRTDDMDNQPFNQENKMAELERRQLEIEKLRAKTIKLQYEAKKLEKDFSFHYRLAIITAIIAVLAIIFK